MSTPQPDVVRWARLNHYPAPVRISRDHEPHAQALTRWLNERGLSPQNAPDMPADPITLDEWARVMEEHPVTVKRWVRRASVRPRVARPRKAPGSGTGTPPGVFSLAELEAIGYPSNRRIEPATFAEGERLTLYAIGRRGKLPDPRILYNYSDEDGFPEPDPRAAPQHQNAQALYDARAVAAWFNRLPGRRGKRRTTS